MNLLDLIFPKRCVNCGKSGEYVCSNCFTFISFDVKKLCLVCDKPTYNSLTHPRCINRYSIDGCFSAISYNKIAQKLIYSFKYKPYLSDLKTFLSELFIESIIQNEDFVNLVEKSEFIFIPIPLSSSKLRKRGYNQSEILSTALSKKFKIPAQNLLVRTKDTQNQFKLKRKERELNIKGAFELDARSLKLDARNIFLVDDVVTTGATLKEAANVLKRAGAKQVFGLTLARD
ncbi:MAG: hypothetical protein A2798_00360 [Candidatus Levybacteria bacterium RIFCSPHIGHO2_01_FULL_37_17]|nr:MAG: hypothetical protein A2798_00360 [Candidatus Levybacteria bacterium RIFCSPHIGHO2_01_FULL_37_17]OGH36456.1 MAG: hypothetical protein A2959_03005 [Candidatus Levybacteria bacterium RIFCSPLOWO2_01_FULL_38_23]